MKHLRILFTGASSFTGTWFVRSLAAREHEIVAIFRRDEGGYEGIRARRVALACEAAEPRFGITFGDERFLDVLKEGRGFDLLCHHAAEVADYKSPDFDAVAALGANTRNLTAVLATLRDSGGPSIVLTGSVFEQCEGAGEEPLRAFGPYGLSKGLTSAMVAFYAEREGVRFSKFVIPNPFGPYEEPRFTTYLARTWLEGRTPTVATPAYVRDNIHVSLLAKAYAAFVESVGRGDSTMRMAPSGYVESQGAFAARLAAGLEPRLGTPCPLELMDQVDFSEPLTRINTDRLDHASLGWSEEGAWDELADYYREALTDGN